MENDLESAPKAQRKQGDNVECPRYSPVLQPDSALRGCAPEKPIMSADYPGLNESTGATDPDAAGDCPRSRASTRRRWVTIAGLMVSALISAAWCYHYLQHLAALRLEAAQREQQTTAMEAGLAIRDACMYGYAGAEMVNEAGPRDTYQRALAQFIDAFDWFCPSFANRAYAADVVRYVPDDAVRENWHDLLMNLQKHAEPEPDARAARDAIRQTGVQAGELAKSAAAYALRASRRTIPLDMEAAGKAYFHIEIALARFSDEVAQFEQTKPQERTRPQSRSVCERSRFAGLWMVAYLPELMQMEGGTDKVRTFLRELAKAASLTRELAATLPGGTNEEKTGKTAVGRYAESMERRAYAIASLAAGDYEGGYQFLLKTIETAILVDDLEAAESRPAIPAPS